MKIAIKISILLIILAFALDAYAQQKTPLRLELNARLTEDSYELITCDKQGLIIFFEEDEVLENGKKNWHFALFDQRLQEGWMGMAELQKGMAFYKEALLGDLLYLFFTDVDGKRSIDVDFQVVKIQLGDGNISVFDGQNQEKAEPSAFKVINDKIWIGLVQKRTEAELAVLDLTTGINSIFSIDIPNQNVISEIFYDTADQQVHLIIQNYTSKLQSGLFHQVYNLNGSLISTEEIKAALNERYLNDAMIVVKAQEIFFLGTYNAEQGKIPYEGEDGQSQAAGFYIAKFEDGEQTFINYYNFLEFENLYNSLSGRDIMKVRKKAEKQKDKDEEYSLNYSLLLHPVLEYDGNFILVAEAFYPEYRTVTNMYYDYYGRLMPQTYTVFDGYKYFNGIAASFDREGNMVWDNDIEIWNVLTFDLDKYLNVFIEGGELAMFYTWEGKLNYKIIDIDLQTADSDQASLELKYKKDKVLDETGSRIAHWYDQYFIAYGYQEIKNNSLSNSKRTVFYINKVAFQ